MISDVSRLSFPSRCFPRNSTKQILIYQPVFRLGLIFGLVLAFFAGVPVQPVFSAEDDRPTLYVKAKANGNCLSWNTACDLQTALSQATPGDQIYMAAGTYTPTGPGGSRVASFQLVSDVHIYGGFPGDGAPRDPASYQTILSGDLNENDSTDPTSKADNSYHVVKADGVSNVLLDGLTITGGNANVTNPNTNGMGGGLFIKNSSLTLANLQISDNKAMAGAGLIANGSTLVIENVSFVENVASGEGSAYGGGGLRSHDSDLTLTNVNFHQNTSDHGGGLLLDSTSTLIMNGGTFSNNTARWYDGSHFYGKSAGGGMMVDGSWQVRINNVLFENNQANDGGGLASIGGSPVLVNVTFRNNDAYKPAGFGIYGSGGGLFAQQGNPILVNVQFINNTADDYGGAIDNYLVSNMQIINATFVGNSAKIGGGLSSTYSNTTLNNVSIANNTSTYEGGAIFVEGGNLRVNNSILWGNTSQQTVSHSMYNKPYGDNEVAEVKVHYSVIHDCDNNGVWSARCGTENVHNLFVDPQFVDLQNNDLNLKPNSPAIDSGSNALVPHDTADLDNDQNTSELIPFDLAGKQRIVNHPAVLPDTNTVDRGAYEAFHENLTANNLTLTENEDTVVTGQVTASTSNGVTFALKTQPSEVGASFAFNSDGSFTYIPRLDFAGTVSFTYEAVHPTLGTAMGVVTINFQPVNDPPVNTAPPAINVLEGAEPNLSVTPGIWNDDKDGATNITYTYQWQRADNLAGLNLADIPGETGSIYTPGLADKGKFLRVAVTATDDGVGTPGNQSVTVYTPYFPVIKPEDLVANNLSLTADEDSTVNGQVTANLTEGVTFSIINPPSVPGLNFTFNADGTFTYQPPPDFTGPVTFTFLASHNESGMATGTVQMTFQPVNDPPVNSSLPVITEAQSQGRNLTVTPGSWNDDKDGNTTITYAYQWQRADNSEGLNLVNIAGAVGTSYTPGPVDVGKYLRVIVTATDNGIGQPDRQSAAAYTAYFQVTNEVPQTANLELHVEGNLPVTGQLSASDPDGDPLTFTVLAGPAVGLLDLKANGSFTYTPPESLNETVFFTFQVTDGMGGSTEGKITLHYKQQARILNIFLPFIHR